MKASASTKALLTDRAGQRWRAKVRKQAAEHVTAADAIQVLDANLGNREWRLRNLYYIVDKSGARVLFVPNSAQQIVYDDLSHKSVVLKIRQPGVTTGLCILWLDSILFSENLKIGIVADTLPNARRILLDKVIYPYDNLPDEIKARIPVVTRNTEEFSLANGSRISIGTSFRSGTVQALHITEYGDICAKHPVHATEVKSGAMQAVPQQGIIVVESTAAGRSGHFFDLVQDARKSDSALSDWKFTFLAWWQIPEYTKDGATLEFRSDTEYLDQLERDIGKRLEPGRRRWWCSKRHDLGDMVWSQYPGTPDEAFKQSTEGAYYGKQILEAWQQGRIGTLLIDPNLLAETWWDIGMGDANAIWFVQRNGNEIRLVDYYENSGEVLKHYIGYIDDWKKRHNVMGFARHIAPHDIANREWTADISGERRIDTALKLGFEFVGSKKLSLSDGIDMVRRTLPLCRFDAERCDKGIKALEHYRKEWNDMLAIWRDQPLHNWASHAADAFRTGATYGDPAQVENLRSHAAIVAPPRRKVIW